MCDVGNCVLFGEFDYDVFGVDVCMVEKLVGVFVFVGECEDCVCVEIEE